MSKTTNKGGSIKADFWSIFYAPKGHGWVRMAHKEFRIKKEAVAYVDVLLKRNGEHTYDMVAVSGEYKSKNILAGDSKDIIFKNPDCVFKNAMEVKEAA